MESKPVDDVAEEFKPLLDQLHELREFPGAAKEFWQRFLVLSAKLISADIVVLLLRQPAQPGQTARWVKLGEWTAHPGPSRQRTDFTSQLEAIGERTLRQSILLEQTDAPAGCYVIATRLKSNNETDEIVLATQVRDFTEGAARDCALRLSLVSDTPASYLKSLAAGQAVSDVEKFGGILDLLIPVNEAAKFLPASLAVCNGMTTRFHCDRVSLGWLEGGVIKLKAISRTEHFDRRMSAAQALEIVMEECLDQDLEVVWNTANSDLEAHGQATPRNKDSENRFDAITHQHEEFSKEQKVGNLCSVPLRIKGKAVAVLTSERRAAPFIETELQQLRLFADHAVNRLEDLREKDRWIGARAGGAVKRLAATILGPEHTWSKLTALFAIILLAALFLVRVNYRIEGNFILRSDEASYLTAPFDGYIERVMVRTGDHVNKGDVLLTLNRSELLLDESAALADLSRAQREAQKAEADRKLAEKRIADAQAAQAQARLDLVRYRLENSAIKAPFEGVVVEGDLRERIAAPVKQGEALYKVAKIDTLYAEGEIPEREIQNLLGHSRGLIAFVTQPKNKFPVTVQMVQSAAVTKKDGNVFLVRLVPDNAPESWWRPGMTGLCKVYSEKRSLFWILTHRTADFLRMKLWF